MIIIMVFFVCEAFSLWSTFLSMNLRELVKTKLKEGLTQRELLTWQLNRVLLLKKTCILEA